MSLAHPPTKSEDAFIAHVNSRRYKEHGHKLGLHQRVISGGGGVKKK